MKNKEVIEELYYHYSNEAHKLTPDIKKITEILSNKTEQLNKTLSEEQQKLFDEIMELENERSGLLDRNVFIYAFSFATRLCLESFNDQEK